MTAYYNEIDPYAAQWLRNLITAGHIAPGFVDERSIEDVRPNELMGYKQCHFFAGIAVWSYALRQAGWPDDRQVWTGSCPCQPFSAAGKGAGFEDERHLWPAWMELIATCKPSIIFGEQVASSGVMGHANEGMYTVRGGQTAESVQAIYRARSAWVETTLQGVPTSLREKVAQSIRGVSTASSSAKISTSGRVREGIPVKESGFLFDFGVPPSCGEEGISVRSGQACGEDTGADGRRNVRAFRVAFGFRPDEEDVARIAVHRPDQARERIRVRQHPNSLLCGERDDGQLGAGGGAGDRSNVGYEGGSVNEQRGIAREGDYGADAEIVTAWVDAVFDDLESAGYACAAVAFPAAGIGAPHIRDRSYWVGHANDAGLEGLAGNDSAARREGPGGPVAEAGLSSGLADTDQHGRIEGGIAPTTARQGDTTDTDGSYGRPDPTNGWWEDVDWLLCRDGKWRPVESGTFPLAHGATSRVGRLRAYGNAINAYQAQIFIASAMEAAA